MNIVANYTPPISFTLASPSYRAASALGLDCEVEGAEDAVGLLFDWSSTCSGNCFALGGTSRMVSTPYLHSYDTGVYTCVVYDALGCTGNASIVINVVGKKVIFLLVGAKSHTIVNL